MNEAIRGIITKKDDGSEQVNYNNDNFPAYLHAGWVEPWVTWVNMPHFHEDLEFITITHGKMGYNINGEKVYLEEGDTLMVNSNQLHFSFTTTDDRCTYYICILHPSLLCSSYVVQNEAVEPITKNTNLKYIHIKNTDNMAKEFFNQSQRLMDSQEVEFNTTLEFFHMFKLIRYYCRDKKIITTANIVNTNDINLKNMLKFIRNNYEKKITLDDIAKAGNVSKTYCNMLFKQFTGYTPMESLNRYRADRVAYYVIKTDMSMSEIAEKTGFSGASYMTETFKKIYGVAPRNFVQVKG